MHLDPTDVARFWRKVDRREGCWPVKGCPADSYPKFYHSQEGRKHIRAAHRVAYHLAHGEIAAGLVIDHICCSKNCVRPEHLQAVTRFENVRLGWERKRRGVYGKGCPNGHGTANYRPYGTTKAGSPKWRCEICYKQAFRNLEARARRQKIEDGTYRGALAVYIHCPKGHRRTSETVRFEKLSDGKQKMVCRICSAIKQRKAGDKRRRAAGVPLRPRKRDVLGG